jgi:hypothetical protein
MKVKCIDNSNLYKDRLTIDKIYEVEEEDPDHFKLIDDNGATRMPLKTRFQVVDSGEMIWVECIHDDAQPEEYTVEQLVKKGQKYHATSVKIHGCHRFQINGVLFNQTRFKVIPSEPVQTLKTLPVSSDSEEDRMWKTWMAPQAGCCPCNIPRETCRYHRL